MLFMKALEKIFKKRQCLVFLDFEGTQFSHEMIAFGVVLVSLKKDLSIRRIYKGKKGYVKPINKIGSFVIKLTSITEELLKESGISFGEALNQIKQYCGKNFQNSLFITFGDHDLRILSQSARYSKDYDKEALEQIKRNYLDLSSFLGTYIKDEKGNSYSLENYLKIFNLPFNGEKHDPLADALNLARLYNAFIKNKKIVAAEYKKVLLNYKKMPAPLVDLLKVLKSDDKVTIKDLDIIINKHLS